MAEISVMIAEDHELMRHGLVTLLETAPGIRVTGQAENGKILLEKITHTPCDVVLMDVNMPVLDGYDATRHLREQYPNIKILVLTMYDELPIIQGMLNAGAHGYALKNTKKQELLNAITAVHNGSKYYSDQVMNTVMESLHSPAKETPAEKATPKAPPVAITKREREILCLLVTGHSAPQIAEKLFIAEHTVKTHRRNLLSKVGAANTAALVHYAMTHGLCQ